MSNENTRQLRGAFSAGRSSVEAKELAQAEALTDGVFAWLENHPVAMGEIFEGAIQKAVAQWLNQNADKMLEAITKQSALQQITAPDPVQRR